MHGSVVIIGMLCYAGDAEAGERAIAPFRALATPIADMVQPGPITSMYPPDDPSYRPIALVAHDVRRRRRPRDRLADHRATRCIGRVDPRRAAARPWRGDGTRRAGGDGLRPPRQAHPRERGRVHRRARAADRAGRLGGGADRRAAGRRPRCLRELPRGRRRRDASTTPTRRRPGSGSRRSSDGTTRTTCSDSTRTSTLRPDAGTGHGADPRSDGRGRRGRPHPRPPRRPASSAGP